MTSCFNEENQIQLSIFTSMKPLHNFFLLLVLFLAVSFIFVQQEHLSIFRRLPNDFPKMLIPEGNELTKARVALGKKLFFEKGLSINETVACNTCHKPELAFADNQAVTPGVYGRLGVRNAPTLTNVGYNPTYLFDGFLETLEKQAIVPIEEHAEMAFNIIEVMKRLRKNPEYVKLAKKAYNRELDPFVITRSLGAFQRTLISYQSPYDDHKNGKRKLSAQAKRGMDLFFDELHCANCHNGFNFTDFTTKNNGLYETYADSGRMRVTKKEEDRDLFKVPTLRNIALTAPYMHDGSINSLTEVIKHYESGGLPNRHKSPLLQPFYLSDEDRTCLVIFLESLTDSKFIKRHMK